MYTARSRAEVSRLSPRFWQHQITVAETTVEDFKHQGLPLARIKKVMKSDPEVKVNVYL